jgi:hypothetical protein
VAKVAAGQGQRNCWMMPFSYVMGMSDQFLCFRDLVSDFVTLPEITTCQHIGGPRVVCSAKKLLDKRQCCIDSSCGYGPYHIQSFNIAYNHVQYLKGKKNLSIFVGLDLRLPLTILRKSEQICSDDDGKYKSI